MRMSAEFLPDWRTCGISISSNDGLVHGALKLLVALPVAVGLLHDDAALDSRRSSTLLDVELVVLRVTDAEATFSKSQNIAMVFVSAGAATCAVASGLSQPSALARDGGAVHNPCRRSWSDSRCVACHVEESPGTTGQDAG
jgi:hypothetical protein